MQDSFAEEVENGGFFRREVPQRPRRFLPHRPAETGQ